MASRARPIVSCGNPEGNGVGTLHPHAEGESVVGAELRSIEELRLALLAFKRTYNEQWMLEKYHYRESRAGAT